MLKKISEHLYVFPDTCQVYVVIEENTAVLIDFGSGAVLDYLGELNVEAVTAILVTHHHRDQIQGLQKAAELGIPVYVPHAERELIEDADSMWQTREILNNYNNRQDRFSILYSVPVADTLKDYREIVLNKRSFQILPTPGHTTGSVTLETELDGSVVAFTGDLIYGKGKIWSLAATQWSYNGGEGIPHTILSLLYLRERKIQMFLPSHGEPMIPENVVGPTIERLAELMKVRKQNPRLFSLRETPYEYLTEHVLFNRTSMCDSYVLLSKNGKALIIDLGYDFMAGVAEGVDRSSRRPWLYTFPELFRTYGVKKIDACLSTHYHDDHVAGFNLLRDTYGAEVWCAENFADIIENPADYDIPCLWYEPIPVDRRLPLCTPVRWEEYELTLYPLSGHTRYEVAISFMADGKKFLCIGDQYENNDEPLCNYVYKSVFGYDDFINSAELINHINPDYLLTGHWQRIEYDAEYYKKMMEIGEKVCRLHKELLPLDEIDFDSEGVCASMMPYQATAAKKEFLDVSVSVTNPLPHRSLVKVQLVLPEGILRTDEKELVWEAAAHETHRFQVRLQVPDKALRRERIGCDVTVDNRRLGIQAEMLVTVAP